MKKALIKQWIEACDELIERYENDACHGYICPLCNVVANDCNKCIWVKFERVNCHHDNAKWGDTNDDRIVRIERWKDKLRKMLEKAK